jgi:nucleoside-diphosphate-sugar epimerase
MTSKKLVVTGGSGLAGRSIVSYLAEQGYEIRNVDLMPTPGQGIVSTDPQLTDWGWTEKAGFVRYLYADLTDLGNTIEILEGAEAVIHLAAIARPGLRTVEVTFKENMESSFNVFRAAALLKLRRVVWSSSETVLGLPLTPQKLRYAPIDEAHPVAPESAYALSKVLTEEMARHFNRWTGIPIVGLRFSNVMQISDYDAFPTYWQDPRLRSWNLWGYIDARDAAECCRLALERDIDGAPEFIIAAADTVMNRPSADLLAECFPGVPLRPGVGPYDSLLAIDKARQLLGFTPRYSWRMHLPEAAPSS